MKFEEALECLKKGERIKKAHWKTAYLKMVDKKVKMHLGFRKPWYYRFSQYDILSDDWLISTSHMFVDDDDMLKPLTGNLRFN